ncbi:hypothetical protein ACVWVY_000104 [Bradyrhizobium sp. URHC0002]|jgi:hypothetical protein
MFQIFGLSGKAQSYPDTKSGHPTRNSGRGKVLAPIRYSKIRWGLRPPRGKRGYASKVIRTARR